MGVDVHFEGLRDPTEDYLKKRAAYMACMEADVDPPEALSEYFDDAGNPPEDGMPVEMYGHPAIDGDVMYGGGAVITIAKLPEGVTRIRVYAG
jgi:hypothetical protein